jgi:hypothetical protein
MSNTYNKMELNSDTIMVGIYPEDGGSMFLGKFGF